MSVKYELQVLDELITVDLNPPNFNKGKNKAAFLKKCMATISEEVERINKVLIQEIIGCGIEKQIGCYVHQHQHGIIRLMDIQQGYLSKETNE